MKISYSTDTNHIPISEFNRKQSEVEKLSSSCILKVIESFGKTAIHWMRGGFPEALNFLHFKKY